VALSVIIGEAGSEALFAGNVERDVNVSPAFERSDQSLPLTQRSIV
jgi:hypothetical protein